MLLAQLGEDDDVLVVVALVVVLLETGSGPAAAYALLCSTMCLDKVVNSNNPGSIERTKSKNCLVIAHKSNLLYFLYLFSVI
jgi:hypothetical protein